MSIFRFLRFIFLTGHFRQDAANILCIALLIYNAYNPYPAFIYGGEGSLLKGFMAQTYLVLVWLSILAVGAFGIARIVGGFKFAAQSVQVARIEQGYDATDMSWWEALRYGAYWKEVLLYAISGVIFLAIAYWGWSQEWAVRPWFA